MSLTLQFLLVILFFQFHFAFPSPNPSGLSLRADLDDSPQSPFYRFESLTAVERIENLIRISNARVNYLDSVLRLKANLAPENIQIPIFRESLFYVVAFQIGSQQHPVKLYLDTGGGLIWTQCQPCRNCFPQRVPIYDHRVSSSYGTLPCGHPLCNGDRRLYNCVNGVCVYNVRYGDGSNTKGVASLDSFRFMIRNDGVRSFNNVIFGCSNESSGFGFANGDISGIFGLNISPDSMASQFSPLIHSRFSYCLVPFQLYMPRPIVLRFGEDIPQRPHVQTTEFQLMPQLQYFYYLELLDISVANHRIGFPPDTFRVRRDGTGGFFIDSGLQFSIIDTNTVGINAYETVMAVFRAYYGSRRLVRMEGALGFEACYRASPDYHDFATITFHFNGADYTVGGLFGHAVLPQGFCVAIRKGTAGISILGAWHQQNKRLIYDRMMGVLQFADEQCVNDVL